MAEWICTDVDYAQWQRKIDDHTFEMWEVGAMRNRTEYLDNIEIAGGVVAIDYYLGDELTASMLEELADVYGCNAGELLNDSSLIARYIFQYNLNDFIYDTNDEHRYPTFDTFDKAERFIKQQIGMED